jgi:Xaa-Pro dipeptidase
MAQVTVVREESEDSRVAELLRAQAKADQLFHAVTEQQVIRPGVTESDASRAIRDMAADMFSVHSFWHKRIVRSGPNTLLPYRHNQPDRIIGENDIAFVDFGPVFDPGFRS